MMIEGVIGAGPVTTGDVIPTGNMTGDATGITIGLATNAVTATGFAAAGAVIAVETGNA